MDDRELLDGCLRRAPGAWEEFLARYRPVLERGAATVLTRVLSSAADDDIEAIVEGVFVGLVKDDYAALRAYAGRSTLAGYLRAIAAKVALNHVRSERRKGWLRFRPLEAAASPSAPEPEPPEDPAQLEAMRRALDQLPARDRLLLKLFHLDGASYKEISRIVDMPVNSIAPTLMRAREKLRVLMMRER